MNAVLQRWAPSNGKHCVAIVFCLKLSNWAKFHPSNLSNVYESGPSPAFPAARRQKITTAVGTFLNKVLNVCSNRHEECCLPHVNFIHIYLDPVIHKWMPNRPSTVICFFETSTRQETRNGIFWKSLKLLSPCRLFSRFTFALPPRSCRTSYNISGGSLYSRNKGNRRCIVAIKAQKQKECHPLKLAVWSENDRS